MNRTIQHLTTVGVAALFALSPFSIIELTTPDTGTIQVPPSTQNKRESTPITETRLLFVGDIMLARSVESLIMQHGYLYPYAGMLSTIQESDIAVGNFEGVVSDPHVKTQPFTFTFSVRDEYLKHARTVGFDVLSLANNHSLDFGSGALSHTRERCDAHGVVCIGSPSGVDEYSSTVIRTQGHTIGLASLHTLYSEPDTEALSTMLRVLGERSDIQIVYVHWGNEYELTHSPAQESLAHVLIDAGADAVIGHHPHVVQDVEMYGGKPIFYSLGNFIFDQYFSDDVKEGIAVLMTIAEDVTYSLVPISSHEVSSQPHQMQSEEATALLARTLAGIGTTTPGIDMTNAQIVVRR